MDRHEATTALVTGGSPNRESDDIGQAVELLTSAGAKFLIELGDVAIDSEKGVLYLEKTDDEVVDDSSLADAVFTEADVVDVDEDQFSDQEKAELEAEDERPAPPKSKSKK